MTQQDSWSEDRQNIILEKGRWQLRRAWLWAEGGNGWNSVLRHKCGKGLNVSLNYAPYKSRRCQCGVRAPKYLVQLWYLHNMDKIGEKR